MKTEHVDFGKKGSFGVKKGALHEMLHIPEGTKIPASKLTPHAGDSPLLRRRKATAKGFKAMNIMADEQVQRRPAGSTSI